MRRFFPDCAIELLVPHGGLFEQRLVELAQARQQALLCTLFDRYESDAYKPARLPVSEGNPYPASSTSPIVGWSIFPYSTTYQATAYFRSENGVIASWHCQHLTSGPE